MSRANYSVLIRFNDRYGHLVLAGRRLPANFVWRF
jgi:hypothetical protein